MIENYKLNDLRVVWQRTTLRLKIFLCSSSMTMNVFSVLIAKALHSHIHCGISSWRRSTILDLTVDYQDFGLEISSPLLIRTKLHSRHKNATKYRIYILDSDRTGRSSILGFYCQCLSGARTSSAYSHVFAICWILSQEQYKEFSAVGIPESSPATHP